MPYTARESWDTDADWEKAEALLALELHDAKAEVEQLRKWKRLAIHYETGHAAEQLGCDEECLGFVHPDCETEGEE